MTPGGMVWLMTKRNVLTAELIREKLDEETIAEKLADQPELPPEELTPELWTVAWGSGAVLWFGVLDAQRYPAGGRHRGRCCRRPRGHVVRAVASHMAVERASAPEPRSIVD